jgi:Family of unknown function (DUF5362)
MEQNQDSSLFGLSVDQSGRNHLAEAARWAKFLAIVGFVFCILIALMGIFAGSFVSLLGANRYSRFDPDMNSAAAPAMGLIMAIYYIAIAVLYFFPCLFLFHFAGKMKTALLTDNQEMLNSSFQNLKKMFRFVGIMTIIGLSLFIIVIFFGLIAVGMSR